jgi:transcriptional regulator with XRE-family HTH domain
MRIGELIANWRWAKKLSIRDAAHVFGISAATLSRVENGREMDAHTLGKLLTWMLEEAK